MIDDDRKPMPKVRVIDDCGTHLIDEPPDNLLIQLALRFIDF